MTIITINYFNVLTALKKLFAILILKKNQHFSKNPLKPAEVTPGECLTLVGNP